MRGETAHLVTVPIRDPEITRVEERDVMLTEGRLAEESRVLNVDALGRKALRPSVTGYDLLSSRE